MSWMQDEMKFRVILPESVQKEMDRSPDEMTIAND
jgi:hypothetical protein